MNEEENTPSPEEQLRAALRQVSMALIDLANQINKVVNG